MKNLEIKTKIVYMGAMKNSMIKKLNYNEDQSEGEREKISNKLLKINLYNECD